MKTYTGALWAWVPIGLVITGLCGLVYATLQQNYRQTWNDPQAQIVETISSNLDSGLPFEQAIARPLSRWDLREQRVSPWVALFDADGKQLVSEVMLDAKGISIPAGVFDAAKQNKGKDTIIPYQNRVTWQPAAGIRSALVVQYDMSIQKYIVAGRNMQEVESRERQLATTVIVTWLFLILSTLLTQLALLWSRINL